MKSKPFALERFFAAHEFSAEYLLSSSDCETMNLAELLALADDDGMQLWENLSFGYTETPGHPVLRESVAEIYQGVGRDNIMVVVPEEGIFLAMQTLLEPGSHVICTFPGYQSLYELARSMGCDVSLWKPDEDRGWHFSIRELRNMMRDKTCLVVVNFPHNPTGYLPTHEEFTAIVDLARQSGAFLFADEMYRFLEIEPDTTLPSACELYHKAISLCGLSKTFGLPGLRIGWVVTQDLEILEQMSLFKDYTTICNSAPGEILGLMAVRARDSIIARQQTRIQKNLHVLDNFMRRFKDRFRWNRPLGSSVCFPRMLMSDNTFEFCETLIRETGIMLVPSRMFEYGDGHVRIGFGRDDFADNMERFSNYLETNIYIS